MNILITGANGFTGHYLIRELLHRGQQVVATGKGPCRLPFRQREFRYLEMDFTDHFQVYDVLASVQPAVIIHLGAMSKPNECEEQQMKAYITNVEGTVTLLHHAEDYTCHFIFLSTDFIFSGNDGPYKEEDGPAPVNYYGFTKMQAEEAVMEYPFAWTIIRTVLVYGKSWGGRDNLLTMVQKKLQQHLPMQVVHDQVRTPTFAADLAIAIADILHKRAEGIYHIAGSETMTPYEMAVQAAAYLHLDTGLLHKATAADFTEPAKRPLRTGFVIDKAKKDLGFSPVPFKVGLQQTFQEIDW